MDFQATIVHIVKRILKIDNLSLWVRKRKQNFSKYLYREKYTANDILGVLINQGLKPGDTLMVHCAMNNFYNYQGNVREIIDKIICYLGPDGTLCMPAYPFNKTNALIPFDPKTDRTAAGLLAETFRNYPGVKRSINKLHSVCAIGKYADFLTSEHQLSVTCFDEKSPFFKLSQIKGKSVSLGLPPSFIGTIGHVCESLLRNEEEYFKNKFLHATKFYYIINGKEETHVMLTGSNKPYVKRKSTKFVDENFDKNKYNRCKLSNIWINMYDVKYCVDRMTELARLGITQYKSPHYYK